MRTMVSWKQKIREEYQEDDDHLSTKPKRRKRLEIMKMMISWKQKIFEEKSLFEDIVCYVLYLIVGVL